MTQQTKAQQTTDMKLHLLPLLLTIGTSFAAMAQKPDSAQALVHYKFTWVRDTTDRTKPYTENMALFVGANASAYKSWDRKLQNDMVKKQIADQVAANGGAGGPISIKRSGPNGSTTEYYQFPNENKLIRKESLISSYQIEEPMPLIKWKISADTSTIGNLHCQKATAHFKGRDYTAWFCSDLSYRSGPWKLNGLPGLIVEAYDAKKDVVFKFDGIDPVTHSAPPTSIAPPNGVKIFTMGGDDSSDPSIIAVPESAIKTSEKEFTTLKEAMIKDPQAFADAAMASANMNMGGPGAPHSVMKIKMNPAPQPVINNPLELPEKK